MPGIDEVPVECIQYDVEDMMDIIHQDDEYIYPSLDLSDDDDDDDVIKIPVNPKKCDQPWYPRGRVGNLVPKTNRPVRQGTKKTAVEKGLEAAAAMGGKTLVPKRQYKRKTIKKPDVLQTTSGGPLAKAIAHKSKVNKKPKKGMATAKQRLGKLLKIHKWIPPRNAQGALLFK